MKKIPINNFDEYCYYEKLPNGLEVYYKPNDTKKNFTVLLGIKYGSTNIEYKKDNKLIKTHEGIAHFLEHKLFDSDTITPFDYYAKTGTDVNAYTTSEYTAFHFSGNNAFLDNLKYLLNWVTNFKTTNEKVEKEKGIILEEERMYQDNPDRILYETIRANTLNKDYHKTKVIGTSDNIKAITKEELETCYNDFYRPDNMFLVLVGSFDLKSASKIVNDILKPIPNPKSKIKKIIIQEPDNVKLTNEIKYMKNITVPKVAYSIKINKKKLEQNKLSKIELDYYLMMIISICFGAASDFREYLLLNNLINTVSYQITEIDTHYLIDFFATSTKPEQLLQELITYLNNLKIAKQDLERIKKVWISQEVKMLDNNDAIINTIIDDILDYGKYINNKIEIIKNMNYETLEKVLKSLDYTNTSSLIILPNN